jgi:hypothetical protein
MTVANNTMEWSASGSGGTVAVSITSQVYDIDELEVIARTVATGAESVLVKTTDYTGSGIPGATPTITTVATYTSATKIYVRRVGVFTQTDDFVNGDSFPDEVVEAILDKDAMDAQVVNDKATRGIKIQKTDSLSTIDTELPTMAASKVVMTNSAGTGFTFGDTTITSDARVNSLFNGGAADDIFTTNINLENCALIIDGTGVARGVFTVVTTDTISEETAAAGVTIDGVLLKDSEVTTDTINEKTGANGVDIDSCLIKDGGVEAVTDQGGGANLLTKVVDIGDWDMDATASVTVAHGITYTKIRSVSAIVRNDADDTYSPLTPAYVTVAGGTIEGAIRFINSTTVNLERLTGGLYDSVSYDSTSYNRGWLTITYTE